MPRLRCMACGSVYHSNMRHTCAFEAPADAPAVAQIQDYPCPQCHRSFSSRHRLLVHGRSEHGGGGQLQPVLRVHAPGRHPCPYCMSAFEFPINRARHMREHHETLALLQCYTCDAGFSRYASFERVDQAVLHVERHREAEDAERMRRFDNPRRLREASRANRCPYCGMEYPHLLLSARKLHRLACDLNISRLKMPPLGSGKRRSTPKLKPEAPPPKIITRRIRLD